MIRRHFAPDAALRLTLLATLLLVGSACSETASSPTEPTGLSASAIMTAYGTVRLDTGGCDFDPAEARAAIDRGYDQARSQIGAHADSISLDGLLVVVHPGPFDGAVGRYSPADDVVEMAEGVERVLRHELQHRFCYELNRSQECCLLQDHPGGYDLFCDPL